MWLVVTIWQPPPCRTKIVLKLYHLHKNRYARWLRMVLSLSETPPAAELVRAGLVRELVEFLRARGENKSHILMRVVCCSSEALYC